MRRIGMTMILAGALAGLPAHADDTLVDESIDLGVVDDAGAVVDPAEDAEVGITLVEEGVAEEGYLEDGSPAEEFVEEDYVGDVPKEDGEPVLVVDPAEGGVPEEDLMFYTTGVIEDGDSAGGEVVEGEVVEGEVIDGEVVDAGGVDGEVVDGEAVDPVRGGGSAEDGGAPPEVIRTTDTPSDEELIYMTTGGPLAPGAEAMSGQAGATGARTEVDEMSPARRSAAFPEPMDVVEGDAALGAGAQR